jgi:hypothetical protein
VIAIAGDELRAHQAQWFYDAIDRPLPQRAVAGHDGRERLSRKDTREQTDRRTGVLHVENVRRLAQAMKPDTVHVKGRGPVAFFEAGLDAQGA